MTIQLAIKLDRVVRADLERERSLADHPSVEHTLLQRIAVGIDLIRSGGEEQLEWRPLSDRTSTLAITVDETLLSELETSALFTGFEKEAVVATFAESRCCKPLDVINAEIMSTTAVRPLRDPRLVRSEPGGQQIFRAWFDLPGHQLAFLAAAGQGRLSQSAILEEALVALAHRARETQRVGGMPLSSEARSFADRVLRLSGS